MALNPTTFLQECRSPTKHRPPQNSSTVCSYQILPWTRPWYSKLRPRCTKFLVLLCIPGTLSQFGRVLGYIDTLRQNMSFPNTVNSVFRGWTKWYRPRRSGWRRVGLTGYYGVISNAKYCTLVNRHRRGAARV